ncbi:MAG TPA: winged helix-turn-helix domain-containing protein [Cellulomonas sp.]
MSVQPLARPRTALPVDHGRAGAPLAPHTRTATPDRTVGPAAAGLTAVTEARIPVDAETARQIHDFERLLAGLPLGPVVLIDAPGRRLLVNGAEVPLTLQEFDLVLYLARAAGRVVTRDELYQAAWHRQTLSPATRTVDVHVRRVRAKSGLDGLITTVRGVGYRLNPIEDLHLLG